MKDSKNIKRWLAYVALGAGFGVADYFIETLARQFLMYPALFFVGLLWVVPSMLVAIYEIKKTGSKKRAILASILVWVVAVVAYYMVYAVALMLDESITSFSWSGIFLDVAFWGVAAIIGGVIAWLLAIVFCKLTSKKKAE
jgi:uncharacterized membrane protein